MAGKDTNAPAAGARKRLVVNADDLGMSRGVNRGIFEAHERGIVTSASLMVRWPAVREGAAYAKSHPRLGVGLHLDFAEWAIRDEQWVRLYEVVNLDDLRAVRREVERQVEQFLHVMDAPPTHLDSHQHVHQDVRVRGVVEEAAARLGVPLRHDGRIRYCGDFYGQDEHGVPYPDGICVDALVRVIHALPDNAVTEMACHPGYDDTEEDGGPPDTMYWRERTLEVAVLCDPRVRQAVEACGVELVNFRDLG